MWNSLDEIYLEYLTTDKDFTRNTLFVPLKDYNYTDLWNMAFIYRYAHPQYYFLRPRVSAVKNNKDDRYQYALTIEFYDLFKNGSVRALETIKVRKQLEEWCGQLKEETSNYDKTRTIHDLICKKVSYDNDVVAAGYDWDIDSHYSQSMYSVATTDKTVCAGYAITFSCLANYCGLNNTAVTGSGHAWDMAAIDGNWYNIDVCWDDGYNITYSYFLVSDKQSQNNNNYHFKEEYWEKYIHKADKNWNGFEEYNEENIYYGNPKFLFGNHQISYNLGKVRLDQISGLEKLPNSYLDIYATKIPKITRKGYTFVNWKEQESNKIVNKIGGKKNLKNKDYMLYAEYEPICYNIKFIKNNKNAIGTMKQIKKIKYDESITLPECSFVYKGKTFAGWSLSKNGNVDFLDGERIGNLTEKGETIKLYAIWK